MTVVDLFAGARGWDLGAKAVGLDPLGIENWGPAIATSQAAGFRTLVADLADLCPHTVGPVDGLIASPPCPDWSAAGSRAKRDGKTGSLVDVPMVWARALRPRWLAWEQVPPALEVWEVNADELRSLGYSVWTGVLNAANYGVPQTRERAFLLASLDRPALPPEPTHARAPEPSLFGPQHRPWVSMGEALEFHGALHTNRDQRPDGTRQTVGSDRPAPTLTGEAGSQWYLRPGVVEGRNRRYRSVCEPAPTVCFGNDAASWVWELPATTVTGDPRLSPRCHHDNDVRQTAGAKTLEQIAAGEGDRTTPVRLTIQQALVLQTFPPDYPLQGTKGDRFKQVGNAVPPLLAHRILETLCSVS